jgi:hypothetical protein
MPVKQPLISIKPSILSSNEGVFSKSNGKVSSRVCFVEIPERNMGRIDRSISRDILGDTRFSSSITEFCSRHRIGRTTYFSLRKRGLGPKEIRFGRVVRISAQAEAEWIERMQSMT